MKATHEGERPRAGTLSTPVLIGRDHELQRLVVTAAGPPAVVLLEGEAGVGKTRLVREMARDPALAGRRLLVGHCHRMREPFPLGPLVEALSGVAGEPLALSLSGLAGTLRPVLPELAPKLPPPPDPLGDPRAERHRVFRALRELLGAIGPTVLVLEDLHWADEGTLELLSFLVSELPEGISLVLTYRGEDLEPSASLAGLGSRLPEGTTRATIALSRLPVDDVGRLAAAILDAPEVSAQLALSLHRQTAGIPFAIEELVRLLKEHGDVARVEGVCPEEVLERVAVPAAVRHSILARLRSLGPDGRLVARAAAVLERPAGEELVRTVAGLPRARGARGVGEALCAAVLEEQDAGLYRFRHALAAQAVYDDIPTPERRRLHLRAARALEAGPAPRPLPALAHHFKQANRSRQWLRYAEAAADAAGAVGDDRSAARILTEVLQAQELPRAARTRMGLKLGHAALFARVPERAIGVLRGILDDDGLQRGVRGELRFCISKLLLEARGASAQRELRQAAEELKRRPRLAARAMAALALREPIAGEGRQKLLLLGRALDAAERQDDEVVTTEVLWVRSSVLLSLGDPAGWRALEQLPWGARSPEQRQELVRACKYLAHTAMWLGHHRRAESLVETAERIREELGHGRFAVGLATTRAALDWRAGRWEGLEHRARALMEANTEAPGFYAENARTLGRVLLARGELAAAERTFASVLEVPGNGKASALSPVAADLATIQLARDDEQGARELATAGLDRLDEKALWARAPLVAPVAVDALIACGERREASDLVRRFGTGLRGRDAPAARAALAFSRGAVAQADGRRDAAARCFARAERAWSCLPFPYAAAAARERRGRSLLAAGDGKGGDCLISALADFHALGAGWDAARVRAQLRERGVAVPYPLRGGRRRYQDELSPREAEVARLTRMGWTTREIGTALFLSPRTVEKHAASAKRKLGLEGRGSLANAVAAPKLGVVPP